MQEATSSGTRGGVGVLGIATALPGEVRTNDWWASRAVDSRGDVFERPSAETLRAQGMDPEVAERFAAEASDPFLGAVERRVLEADRQPSDLELEAATAALARAGLDPSQVDLLVTFSHLADVAAPSNAPLLAHRLGLRRDVLALGAEREGASFPMHVELAAHLLAGGRYRHALLVQSAVMSRVVDPAHVTSRVVGDGAVATVLGPVPAGHGFLGAAHATLGDFHRMAQLLPGGDSDAPWYRGDRHGAALSWQSPEPGLSRTMGATLASTFESVARPLLDAAGVHPDELAYLVTYEPRGWAAEVFAERLGIPASKTFSRFSEVGYTLAASVGIALEGLANTGRLADSDRILLYAKGSGAASSACLIRWSAR